MSLERFTPSDPKRGAWLVYVNGIEIPCPHVTFSYGVWQIPEATISFAPHRALQRLGAEDRVEVVIFWLDSLTNPEKPVFRLAMEGEIVGWSYSNAHHSRSMQFNVVGDIAIFTQLYFFFMNTVQAIVENETGTQAQAIAQAGVFYPFSLFKKGLVPVDPSKPLEDITTPFELVYNVVRGLTSNKVPRERRALPAVNFFARWVRKRNFHNRFAALPLFEDDTGDMTSGVFPIFKAVQDTEAVKAMSTKLAQTVGDAGHIFNVLQTVLGQAYFELAMIPTAPCFHVRLEDGVITKPVDVEEDYVDPMTPPRLINYFVKPQFLFGIPPTCNVIFPSMISSIQFQESFLQQPTRVYFNEDFIGSMLDQNTLTAAALRVGYPPEVNFGIQRSLEQQQAAQASGTAASTYNPKNVLIFPEEFYKGPVISRTQLPHWFWILQNRNLAKKKEADEQMQSNADGSDPRVEFEEGKTQLTKLYELYAQYEYYRQRYEKRGGAADLAFNPFLVPGFPCMVFDQRVQANDIAAYLMNVTQTFSVNRNTGTMRTTINYSFGRTFSEMLDALGVAARTLKVQLGNAPPEPIDQVRDIIQDFEKADQFYTRLFFGGQDPWPEKKASFDFREVVQYVDRKKDDRDASKYTPIELSGPSTSDRNIKFQPDGPVPATPTVTHNLDPTKDIAPAAGFEDVFENYDAAMRYVARPICTLQEYIYFLHGGRKLSELMAPAAVEDPTIPEYLRRPAESSYAGQVSGEQRFYAYEGVDAPAAIYYTRIRKLRTGPGQHPGPATTGANVAPPPEGGTTPIATPFIGAPKGVGANFPQTRADWDSMLLAYREEILNNPVPQR